MDTLMSNQYRVRIDQLVHAVTRHDYITYCNIFTFELSAVVKSTDKAEDPVNCMTCLVKCSYE